MINYSNITDFTGLANPLSSDICKTAQGAYSPECLIRNFCPQISEYFVKMGLIIVVVCIILTWLSWWFFTKGYKKIDWEAFKIDYPGAFAYLGDLRELDTRFEWDAFIRDKLLKWCIGFIVVMIYLYLRL